VFSLPSLAAEMAISFPANIQWVKVTDQASGGTRIREWVPSGRTADDTNWIIVQQVFTPRNPVSAKSFLENMMKGAQAACVSIKYNGPEAIALEGLDSYWGRTFCSQVRGRSYGTITEQRVVSEGNRLHVVTSELHLAPTATAGGYSFSGQAALDEFKAMTDASAILARRDVHLCAKSSCE
jgi:hypothetical protein